MPSRDTPCLRPAQVSQWTPNCLHNPATASTKCSLSCRVIAGTRSGWPGTPGLLSDTAADLRRRRRLKRELRRTVKIALAKVAEIAIPMTICHFLPTPAGTRRWSTGGAVPISTSWRGRPRPARKAAPSRPLPGTSRREHLVGRLQAPQAVFSTSTKRPGDLDCGVVVPASQLGQPVVAEDSGRCHYRRAH